ncbi:MAG: hypothetical protein MUC47_05435 [Candidatus Kapabacteria bacterium]|jgi:hypothetical protein|nr:hypothetical protein [Candidatus Kapabacteria bacterium]
MKRLSLRLSLCIAIVLLAAPSAYVQAAQPDSVRTLFSSGTFSSGGFGGPVLKLTTMMDNTSLLVGGRGAWVINKTLAIGGGGYGLVTPRLLKAGATSDLDTNMNLGYGGGEIEVIFMSDDVIHVSAMTLIGAGAVSTNTRARRFEDGEWDWDHSTISSDVFFVIEPQVNIEVNLTEWFRVAAGASYRFVNGVDTRVGTTTIGNSDLSGLSGVLTFKFGLY